MKKNMDFTALHLYTLLPVHTLIWSHVIITNYRRGNAPQWIHKTTDKNGPKNIKETQIHNAKDLIPKTNFDLILFAHKLGAAICVAPGRGSNTTGNPLFFNLWWKPGRGYLPAQILHHRPTGNPLFFNFWWKPGRGYLPAQILHHRPTGNPLFFNLWWKPGRGYLPAQILHHRQLPARIFFFVVVANCLPH